MPKSICAPKSQATPINPKRTPRAYSSVFFMLLGLATGIVYFTTAIVGIAVSAGRAFLIVGFPFFLAFIGIARVISLGEGRLLEAMTGERMPRRRPVHPGPAQSLWARIVAMLKDARTWTTLVYFILMLPLGIAYFVVAVVGLFVGIACIVAPIVGILGHFDLTHATIEPAWLATPPVVVAMAFIGVVVLTTFMHVARGIGRLHARVAKRLLVTPG